MADCNTHVQYDVMQEERIVLYPDPRYMHTGGLADGLGKDQETLEYSIHTELDQLSLLFIECSCLP